MLYCELCMILVEAYENKCPECRHKKLRPPKDNDPVYLLSKEVLWSGGIEEVLKENGIPCMKKSLRGSAFSIIFGQFGDLIRFYVPFAALEKSKELLAGFMGEDDLEDTEHPEDIELDCEEEEQ